MFDETAEDLAALAAELHEQYAPANATERFLVDTLISNQWRLHRVEVDLWQTGVDSYLNKNTEMERATSGDAFRLSGTAFERLQRHVNSCERGALKELHALATAGRAPPSAATTRQAEESKTSNESPGSICTDPHRRNCGSRRLRQIGSANPSMTSSGRMWRQWAPLPRQISDNLASSEIDPTKLPGCGRDQRQDRARWPATPVPPDVILANRVIYPYWLKQVRFLRIALLQINPTAGDLSGNSSLIVRGVRAAQSQGAHLVVTPELALMGYLPRDLLMSRGFVQRSCQMLTGIAEELRDAPAVLVGVATPNPSDMGRPLFNSAVLLDRGSVGPTFHKTLLPTYDVFDEDRYFEPGVGPQILEWNGRRLGISICEDVWNDRDFWQRRRYHQDPIEALAQAGVEAILNLSASPFTVSKQTMREEMLGHMARRHRIPLAYVNQVGGNDDLIFDGRSCAFDATGRMFARAKGFEEDVLILDLPDGGDARGAIAEDDFEPEAEIWNALVLGVRDYVRKTRFRKVLLGLSGGIDSALTAAIAADAVGPQNVLGVMMPSVYSSAGSVSDSVELAQKLSIRILTLSIADIMQTYGEVLKEPFQGLSLDVTEENIQSRIRGNLLMALSNKFGAMLLTTGNKSEMSVGYCTLYGDMNGGLAVIADLPKMMVYRVSRWRNRRSPVIPESTLTKAPSAELRPDQTDRDSLPPYELLDEILERHVEKSQSAEEIIAQGFDEATVRKVLRLVRMAEFKRKQAAPVLKVTSRAFGTGWRMPIVRQE